MTVELDRLRAGRKSRAVDPASGGLAGDELVDQERVFRKRPGVVEQCVGHKVGIFVAKAEDGRRLNADEWRAVRDDSLQQLDVADRKLLRFTNETF